MLVPDLVVASRLVIAAVFAISAGSKLRHPLRFAAAIRRYRIVPEGSAVPIAAGILAAEILVALSFGLGIEVDSGRALTLGLLLVFVAVSVINAVRSDAVPCPCFGAEGQARPLQVLGRLGLLLLALTPVLFASEADLTRAVALEHGGLALGALIAGLWLLEAPTLIRLHRAPTPQIRHAPRRVSLRGLPLEPIEHLLRRQAT